VGTASVRKFQQETFLNGAKKSSKKAVNLLKDFLNKKNWDYYVHQDDI